jgi:predicted enzyme related to lactoylglutathione lyase
MSSNFFGVAFDAHDAARTATFWSAVLDRPVQEGATSDHAVVDATTLEAGPRLAFHKVPEPKAGKNRFHPDLIAPDLNAETERLISLGAIVLNTVDTGTAHWTTFADPEGNEFDVIAGG